MVEGNDLTNLSSSKFGFVEFLPLLLVFFFAMDFLLVDLSMIVCTKFLDLKRRKKKT